MMTQELDHEARFQGSAVEHVIHDVEQAMHNAEKAVSHAPPMVIFGVIGVLSIVVLVYRLITG